MSDYYCPCFADGGSENSSMQLAQEYKVRAWAVRHLKCQFIMSLYHVPLQNTAKHPHPLKKKFLQVNSHCTKQGNITFYFNVSQNKLAISIFLKYFGSQTCPYNMFCCNKI